MNINEIVDFIKGLNLKSFDEPSREVRRSTKNIHDIEKNSLPSLEMIGNTNKKVQDLDLNIVFSGFYHNTIGYCEIFETDRVLIPLYISFYTKCNVYINIKEGYYKVDYNKGIEKIISPPNFDLLIVKENYDTAENSILKNHIKNHVKPPIKIVLMPIYSERQKCHYMFKNSSMFKCSVEKSFLYSKKVDKKNIILINGTIMGRKGQLEFINDIDPDLIKNYLILLIGKDKNNIYSKIKSKAIEKGINIHFIPFIKSNDMFKIVPYCKYNVNYCSSGFTDANPRSINEGIYSGIPFLISDLVEFPDRFKKNGWLKKIGVICKHNNSQDLNEKMKTLLQLKNDDVYDFCEKECNYNTVCQDITEELLNKYIDITKK